MKNWNDYRRSPPKKTSYAGGNKNTFFSSFYHKHSAIMDLWNEIEVILKITKGKPILCFHVSSGTVGFCLPCLRWVNRKRVYVPATAPWEDTYTFLWLTISHIPTRPLWQFSSLFLWNIFAHLKEKKSVRKHLPNFISSGHQHKELNISDQNDLLLMQPSLIVVTVIPFSLKKI